MHRAALRALLLGAALTSLTACRTAPEPPKALPQAYPTPLQAEMTEPFQGNPPEGSLYAIDAILFEPKGFDGRQMAYLRWDAACAPEWGERPECAAPHKPVPLSEGTTIITQGIVDLAGDPFIYAHQRAWESKLPKHTAERPRLPAALVQLAHAPKDKALGRRELLFLILLPTADRPAPTVAWRQTLSSSSPHGGGFSTINDIHFVRPEGAAEGSPLVIELDSTSIPAPGDTPYMPGPPMQERFTLQGDAYEHAP